MCCWGYGELLKESHGRGRLWAQLCCWVTVEKELGVSVPQKQMGREMDFKQERCQIPRNCSVNSTLCQVYGLEHRESSEHQAFSYLHPPRHHSKAVPQGCRVGSWGGRGATRWLRGCVNLWEQMGCWLGSGLFSVWDKGGTSPSSMCRKIIWAIAFLPGSSAAKLRKKRKRKEGCSRWAKDNLFVWRTSLTFQNCCGEWIFLL